MPNRSETPEQATKQNISSWFLNSQARNNSFLIWGSCMLFFFSLYSYMSILAVFTKSLGAAASVIGLAVGIYGVGQMIFRIPVGVVADIVGIRKVIIAAGMLIIVASNIGMGLSGSPWTVVAYRFMTSLGASTYLVYAVLLSQQFPLERRSTAMGTLTSASNAGILVGLWIGGQVAQLGGYRIPFYWGAAFAIAAGILIFLVKEPKKIHTSSISLMRIIQIGLMPDMLAVSGSFIMGCMAWYGAQFTLLPLYASKVAGFSKADLGNLATFSFVAGIISTLIGGYVADLVGRRIPALGGLLFLLIAMLLTPSFSDKTMIYVMSGIVGFGWGLCWATFMAMGLSVIEGGEQATAMGVFMAYYALGLYLGPQLGGVVLQFFGDANSFYSLAVIAVIGILIALFAIPNRIVRTQRA